MEGSRKVVWVGQRMSLLSHDEITISCWPAHLWKNVDREQQWKATQYFGEDRFHGSR